MRAKLTGLAIGIGLLLGAALPSMAHHSFTAEYDSTKSITLTGKFIKMDWVNPHSWVWIEVVNAETGKTEVWKCETPPPNLLYRVGWRKDMLKAGDIVTARGNVAKDGSHTAWTGSWTLPDGSVMTMGTAPGASLTKK